MAEKYGTYSIGGLHATGGILEHPNKMGGQLLIALGALIIFRKNYLVRKIILTILLIGLFFTFGRGGWLAAFMGFIAIISISKNKSVIFRKLKPFLIALSVASILILSWSNLKNSSTINSLLRVDQGGSGRDVMWIYALSMAMEKPWTGYGYRSDQFLKSYNEEFMHKFAPNAGWHNVFISHLTQFGIIGLILYLSVFLIPIYRLYHSKLDFSTKKALLFICISLFIAANFTGYNIGGLRSMTLAMSIILGVANMSNISLYGRPA